MLNQALEQARALAGHDHVIAIVSDFDGADAETRGLVAELAEHNDVIVMLVHDPSSKELPERGPRGGDGGELQLQVDVGRAGEREALLALAERPRQAHPGVDARAGRARLAARPRVKKWPPR